MSSNVLDLIDNVIEQHGDAMRWSPDARTEVPAPEWASGSHLVTWADTAVTIQRFTPLFGRLAESLDRFAEALHTRFGEAVEAVVAAQREANRRRSRISRMHSLYRRRRR